MVKKVTYTHALNVGNQRKPRTSRYEKFYGAAVRLLRERGEPMHVKDLTAEVRTTRGKPFTGAFKPSHKGAAHTMTRYDPKKRFVRNGSLIGLAEWEEVDA